MKKIMSIFGTRPEAIKMAPLVKAIEQAADLESMVVVTAQHREMLDQVLALFEITPDYDLNLMKANQTLTDITAGALRGLERVIIKEQPDLVLVHGDTTTTFAASLGAYYQQVPIGHVEAGLRSGNMYSPFPEEANRKLTGALASLHFAPTAEARGNLLHEGITPEKIFTTGNTVIDALLTTVNKEYAFEDTEVDRLLAKDCKKDLHETLTDCEFIFPIHKNPRVRALAQEILGDLERVHMIEPLDYAPFANAMNKVDLILTDSGGVQEEAPALGKPVLVLRENTERPEALEAGTVLLVGNDRQKIYDTALALLTDQEAYAKMQQAINPYGDGQACERIVKAIRYYLGCTEERPADWR